MAPVPDEVLAEPPSARLAWLAIHEGGCRTREEVMRWAGLSNGGTSETLHRLEEGGHVVRVHQLQGDARTHHWLPPEEAEERLEERRPDTHQSLEVAE